MNERFKFLAAILIVSLADSSQAGTISFSIRNPDGTQIQDQAARPVSVTVETAGQTIIARRIRDSNNQDGTPRFKIEYSVPNVVELVFTPPAKKPAGDEITYKLTLKDALFPAPKDANTKRKVAVTVTAGLLSPDRTDPAPVRNLIGTVDSVLNLAFPIAPPRPDTVPAPPIYYPCPVYFLPPCQPMFVHRRGRCFRR